MMDWTDRHCRAFHRTLTRSAVLYTEMVTANAVIFGDRERLLGFSEIERPLILQLGGSDPEWLARAARIGLDWGYDGVNLNVGCPSDRVQEGRFGACLMREPALVAECVAAMDEAAGHGRAEVKCRIGVDDQDPRDALFGFIETVAKGASRTFIIHARKAWLKGLSPKENREIPPLDYSLVQAVKAAFPNLRVHLNGGLRDVGHARDQATGLDGIMLGRAAYQTPAILLDVDPLLSGEPPPAADAVSAVERHTEYLSRRLAEGTPLHAMTRHMLGLFHGAPGGRHWRRIFSQDGVQSGAGLEVVQKALQAVRRQSRELA